jgi:hypothetical protein
LLYGIDGVGFTTNLTSPYKGLYVGFSALFEYDARNTYEVRTNVITAGLNFSRQNWHEFHIRPTEFALKCILRS